MPRNVRNFWIDADIDGRRSSLTGGPVAKDGGFTMRIRQRDDGTVSEPVRVWGETYKDGTVALVIYDENGSEVFRRVTTR